MQSPDYPFRGYGAVPLSTGFAAAFEELPVAGRHQIVKHIYGKRPCSDGPAEGERLPAPLTPAPLRTRGSGCSSRHTTAVLEHAWSGCRVAGSSRQPAVRAGSPTTATAPSGCSDGNVAAERLLRG
jgi:hypothetical protein